MGGRLVGGGVGASQNFIDKGIFCFDFWEGPGWTTEITGRWAQGTCIGSARHFIWRMWSGRDTGGCHERHRNPNKQQDLFSTAWMSCPKVRSKGGIQTVSPGLKEVCYSFKFGAHLYIFLYSCMHIYVYLYMSTLCGITISDSGTQQLFEFNQPVFQEIFLRRKWRIAPISWFLGLIVLWIFLLILM